MKIMGISSDVPSCSSAVLLNNSEVLCGTPEERLNREKNSAKFPAKAIEYCLKTAGIELEGLDAIALSWNPLINACESTSARLTAMSRHKAELLYTIPTQLMGLLGEKPQYLKQELKHSKGKLDLYFIKHHDCHAASTYFESNFSEALILTCDGYGENECLTVSRGSGNKIERLSTTQFPNSLGMFYGVITEFLGFRHDSDEWKVMALGAYSGLNQSFYEKLRALFQINDDCTLKFDTNKLQFNNALKKGLFDREFADYIGLEGREYGSELSQAHHELAFAAQKVFEDIIFELCHKLKAKFGGQNLCLSGGSFMNSLFNGKLAKENIFKSIYIPYAPNDAGAALGAAYYVNHCILGKEKLNSQEMASSYLGPSYSDTEIESKLKLFQCKYEKIDAIEAHTAKLIADGNTVAWFQGAMEFGERALGNRSILADPRKAESKEKVNLIIKFREKFRPFAPSILEEKAEDFFELPKENFATPYMEKVFPIKEERRAQIPSVTHADGTGRLQTVSTQQNPKYHKLISEFYALTETPILLNTSLNRNGEPLACAPEDALAIFYGSGLDYLVLNNFLVSKA